MARALVNLLDSTETVEAEWDQSRFVDPTSAFAGIGWPWCTCCAPFAVGILDSETEETRTYDDRPTEVDAWTAGSGASYQEYTVPPGHLTSVSTKWRFKIGYDFDGILGEDFPTTQTVNIAWTLITRDSGGDAVSRSTGNESVNLTSASARLATSLITVNAPSGSGEYVELYGELKHPEVYLRFTRTSASRRKWGFREYGRPSDPPRFYQTETAVGSLAACAFSGITAKDYDGDQSYDTAGVLTDNRSADAIAAGYYSEGMGNRIPDLEDGLQWDEKSGTELYRDLSYQCSGVDAPGGITLTLTDEVTTADIEDYVDTVIAGAVEDADGANGDAAEILSYRHLTRDESYYERAVSWWRMQLDFGDIEPIAQAGGDVTTPVAAVIVSTELATGATTVTDVSASISTADADYAETPDRESDAAAGYRIHVHSLHATAAPTLASATIYATATTDAAPVFP